MGALIHKLEGDGHILKIEYDEDCDSPRQWDPISKMCVRKHRHYSFPNELDFNFDSYDEEDLTELNEIREKYYVFPMDCYIHSGVSFSLRGEGMQCQFDTSTRVGFVFVPKKYNGYDNKEISDTPYREGTPEYKLYEMTEEDAAVMARGDIETYNQWLNGGVYYYSLEKPVDLLRADDLTPYETDDTDCIDSCGGFYSFDEILSQIPEKEYPELYAKLKEIC